jgi:hypothetical protein
MRDLRLAIRAMLLDAHAIGTLQAADEPADPT